MMQDQSSKARKGPVLNDFPTFISETQDSKDTNNSKTTKFSTMDSLLNDFPLCAPSHEMELDEEVETVSWLNFPIVEPFNDEYCSELLPVLGVAGNETDSASMQRRSNSHHVDELPRPSTASTPSMQQHSISKVLSSVTEQNKLYIGGTSPLMQNQYPIPRRGKSEFTHSDASNANRIPSPVGGSMGSKQHKLDAGQPSNRSAVNNFPYISRLASLSGVNVWNTATTACDVTGGKQRACDKNRGGTINSCNAMEPTLVNSSHQEVVSHGKLSMPPTAGSIESVTSKSDSLPPQQSEALCLKPGKNGKSIDQPLDAVPTEVMKGDERIREPVVATTSICSGNRIERASSDPACSLKRKCRETEDSEGPSDEAEEESVGDRIFSGRTGSKRGRAAEVHNLSERKRRERINKKMRALQELIPSCNKADKASMLDEAIEYMKTLQLQLQILSMGTGMYMPPMMLPSAMQQIHRAQMPQFLPMGIGMGMHDMNYSMTHMPNMQGPCYPVPGPPLSSPTTFPGAVGYSHHFLGHPGQELLMSMPHIPPPLFGIPPTRLPVGNVSAMTGTLDLSRLAPTAGSKEMIQSVSSQKILNDQEKSNE